MEQVFAVPGRPGIIDMAIPREDGVLIGRFSHETISELDTKYPGVILTTFSKAVIGHADHYKMDPVEIDKETFIEMRNVLPPIRWFSLGDTESFKMCEYTFDTITGIYVRIGRRYFKMADDVSLGHEEIISRVRAKFY